MKIEILELDGWVDGRQREVNGVVSIDGVEYKFELETDDGMTGIWIKKEENEVWDNRHWVPASLECDEDLDMYDISEEDGEKIYDEILTFVCENGFELGEED